MRHVPHLYLCGPWESDEIALSEAHRRHLGRVLRLADGAVVSYTDGEGTTGEGELAGAAIRRGIEARVAKPAPEVAVAVAPPSKPNRARFLVEKLAELGVDRLIWLRTRHGEGRPPRPAKAEAWARAALEQSRGAWAVRIDGPVEMEDLPSSSTLWVAERETNPPPSVVNGGILVIGPEAGFAEGEVPHRANRLGLGRRVLRVETAAVVGAAILLDRSGRLSR
ncbi:MAG: RsmE family RNA methyltransferase [Acidimicrobiia bacterium]|nr:RsmE family RNA methyltransferase [Acidimicrobiia bacterium]MBT8192389.1 RsmE family RNA methyltransferase [Acidimicrobiia bacterium]MBT8247170.1 RsmE family RNA methyltransferase [Acidimicrobiia bacterium]NNF87073.1 RsmE family RNA methyltransferase [Acidimicrobiia bacterium]NNJ47714.1 RsmE family RNA methyltransferase [Acidimicrobiia bacterium]